ncbi:MAG TPA: hypothetical protein VK766_00345 [Cytophagaceae bacterium]|jgi:hypothetical protein|nr:hypothetical protein [Cytophagaceae bacterium]
MEFRQHFIDELFKINKSNFNKKALALFNYQYTYNAIYKHYVDSLKKNPSSVQSIIDIPYLPVTFFKSEKIITGNFEPAKCFYSSGTTEKSTRSKHYLVDTDLYKKTFSTFFTNQYGPISDYIILALLPSYQENKDSSLLYMVDWLIQETGNVFSSFVSTDFPAFFATLEQCRKQPKKILLIGVSYALLELAEQHHPNLSDCIVMETGGMKGRRAEMIKAEIHEYLKKSFTIENIHSEYGMTELLSQAYSKENGIFQCPSWMKILVRQVNDPFDLRESGRGAVNIIDLANIDSCAFIEIQDLGNLFPDGSFEILGRMDNTEVRGCNLLYA